LTPLDPYHERQQGRLHHQHFRAPAEYPRGVRDPQTRSHHDDRYLHLVMLWMSRSPDSWAATNRPHAQTGNCFIFTFRQTLRILFGSFLSTRESLLGDFDFNIWQFKIHQLCRLTPPRFESVDFDFLLSPGKPII